MIFHRNLRFTLSFTVTFIAWFESYFTRIHFYCILRRLVLLSGQARKFQLIVQSVWEYSVRLRVKKLTFEFEISRLLTNRAILFVLCAGTSVFRSRSAGRFYYPRNKYPPGMLVVVATVSNAHVFFDTPVWHRKYVKSPRCSVLCPVPSFESLLHPFISIFSIYTFCSRSSQSGARFIFAAASSGVWSNKFLLKLRPFFPSKFVLFVCFIVTQESAIQLGFRPLFSRVRIRGEDSLFNLYGASN